jgi:hypothetical protein
MEGSGSVQIIADPHSVSENRATGGSLRSNYYIQRNLSGDSANAVPHYQKLRVRVTHIWGNRRGQPNRSAMARPHPRGTTFLIMVNLHAR